MAGAGHTIIGTRSYTKQIKIGIASAGIGDLTKELIEILTEGLNGCKWGSRIRDDSALGIWDDNGTREASQRSRTRHLQRQLRQGIIQSSTKRRTRFATETMRMQRCVYEYLRKRRQTINDVELVSGSILNRTGRGEIHGSHVDAGSIGRDAANDGGRRTGRGGWRHRREIADRAGNLYADRARRRTGTTRERPAGMTDEINSVGDIEEAIHGPIRACLQERRMTGAGQSETSARSDAEEVEIGVAAASDLALKLIQDLAKRLRRSRGRTRGRENLTCDVGDGEEASVPRVSSRAIQLQFKDGGKVVRSSA